MTHKIRFWNSRFSKSKLALVMHMLIWGDALAAPIGGEIVGGSGSVTQQGAETTIVQSSERIAIDWQAFDLGENERVEFIQPGKSAVALNRILSDKGSEILGRIDANGHVILVNPNGVVFGQGAVVNAGGLIASGLQINPDDFMNGDLIFKRIEGTDGTVINSGLINAASGGNVALIGTQVENRGLISATLGRVTLASGAEAVLTFDDSGLLGVQVDKAVLQSELGDKAAITNAGELRAEGGQILLSASTTRDVFSQAVNWGEQKQARSVTYSDDGSFTLGAGGDVINSGSISASDEAGGGSTIILGENITHSGEIKVDASRGRGGHVELHSNTTTKVVGGGLVTANAEQGGDIKLLGKNVGLFDQSSVSAMGEQGGGRVLLGGDQEGLNPQVRNADFAYFGEQSSIDVSATRFGNGGTAIVFAEDTARIYGDLSAKGGKIHGDGGFIETSGKRGFSIVSTPDVSATNGRGGHWLIDPYDITIGSVVEDDIDGEEFTSVYGGARIGVESIQSVLENGNNVTLTTGGSEGNITVDAEMTVEPKENSTLTLKANNSIIFKKNIKATGNPLNIHLHANRANRADSEGEILGEIRFEGALEINTNGGDFKIAGDPVNNANDPAPGAYDIDLRNVTIDVGGGNFVAHAENKLTRHQDFEIQNGDLTLGAAEWEFSAPGSPPARISTSNGNITFFTGGELRLPYIQSAGDITLNVRDTKESGEFEVHNRTSSGGGRREFSLGGTLTLNLGFQGVAEIQNIVAGEKLELAIKSGQDATLKTGAAIHLYDSELSGDLTLASGSNIAQQEGSAVIVERKLQLYVGDNNDVTLESAKNILGTSVWVGSSAERSQARNVELNTSQDLNFGDDPMSLKGTLTATAGGSMSQEGAISTSKKITLSAEENIILNNDNNEFTTLRILKAQSATIHNSGTLELASIENVKILVLGVNGILTQSAALSVDELILSKPVEINFGLENSIGNLSGNISFGELTTTGRLELGNLTVGDADAPQTDKLFSLTVTGDDADISQAAESVLKVQSTTTISASEVTLSETTNISNGATLTFNEVKDFTLSGTVKGAESEMDVNGSDQGGTFTITADARWEGVKFHINGSEGVLQGPDLNNTWSIQTDGTHELSAGGQKLSFEKMKVLKGGSATDTLDYSEFSDGADITLWNLPEISAIEDIEIVKGKGNQALVAPENTSNTWIIGNGRNTIETVQKTTVEKANGDVVEPVEVLIKRDVEFQGFTNLKGGSGVDNFIVELDGQGADGSIPDYELYGGEGESSLIITSGTDGWSGKYKAIKDHPKFSFSFQNRDAINIVYDGIESINLTDPLDQIEVIPEDNKIRLGPGWWELEGYERVTYGGGLQDLIVDGSGDLISLVADMGNRPPEAAKVLPKNLTLKNGTLSFNDGIHLQATNLHLIDLQNDIGTKESPLTIFVETLKLENNNGNIYIRELDSLSLGEVSGVGDGKSIDLEVTAGDLSQDSAITMSSGSLNLRALSGNIVLDNDNNKLNVPISLSASGSATVYTQGSLELGEVGVKNLILRAEEGISSHGPVVVEGETRLESGGNISLKDEGNDFGGSVSIAPINDRAVEDVDLADRDALTFGDVNISGGLSIAADEIHFSGIVSAAALTTSVAKNVWVWKLMIIKEDVYFNDHPRVYGLELIHTESGKIRGARTPTAEDQMIEIETLAEIDPAIFTNVKNYFYQDVSVLLPSDQRYEDSSEEETLSRTDPSIYLDGRGYAYSDSATRRHRCRNFSISLDGLRYMYCERISRSTDPS